MVTREELREQVWASDTFVDFEHGLNAAINKLRQALGDSAEKPRFIETLPGQGYRFVAAVRIEPPKQTTQEAPAPEPVPAPSPIQAPRAGSKRTILARAARLRRVGAGLLVAATWADRTPGSFAGPSVTLQSSPSPRRRALPSSRRGCARHLRSHPMAHVWRLRRWRTMANTAFGFVTW